MTVERRPEAVLFITGWWPTEADPHNGVFIREHALALATATPVVVVHLSVVKRKWGLLKFKWQESSDQGLQVIHGEIQTPVRRGGWHDRIVRSAYRKAILKYSDRYRFRVMHIHNRTPITENASFVGEEMGLPVVVTEHSSFYHLWIHHLGAEVGSQTRERIINWFARPSIRAVLPVSRDLGRVLQDDFDVAKEKIHVVPNVASPIFKPAASEHVPPFRILLAARWSAPKDPFLFIDALHLLPVGVRNSLHVDWVGDGDQIEQARAACAVFIMDGIMYFRG
ncbi:MAG: glycosyltransferase [Flavobacteriales bacterium]|nr:glycosyltransferase [Flavobacteriales bacterium]